MMKTNKWIILAAVIFFVWKIFLICTQFRNGLDAPRFNDTAVYITHIDSINQCNAIIFCKEFPASFEGYGGFEHLTYRLFFGAIAHLLDTTSLSMFLASFYIGTLLLIPTLILFLKHLNPNKDLLAFSLLFLALYNGAGSYHGFFWVVPSFFALMFFFILFAVFIGNYKQWRLLTWVLIPSMIYTHFIGLYLLSVLIIFTLFYSLFTKNIDAVLFKKLAFIVLVATLFYIPTAFYLKNNPYGGNPYGIETFTHLFINTHIEHISNTTKNKNNGDSPASAHIITPKSIVDFAKTSGQEFFPGFSQIKTDYLDWIFPHWLAILPFFLLILLLIYYEQYILLSLYFAALSFTFLSSISVYGMRSLLLTWPLTFLIYGYGAWFSFLFAQERIKNKNLLFSAYGVIILTICCFTFINVMYSYSWNHDPSTISIKSLINNF